MTMYLIYKNLLGTLAKHLVSLRLDLLPSRNKSD